MKIILNKDVQNLGEEGDVREVAPGYARNYLIPRGLGVTYTKQNLALLEGKRKAIEKRKEEKKQHAAGLKERIEALNLQISMTVGENGRLFGSVTNAMISDELAKHGVEVERKKVEIPEHTIKNAGNFVLKVKLYGNEVASLKVTVAGPSAPGASAGPADGEARGRGQAAGESAGATPEPEAGAARDEAAQETVGASAATDTAEVATDEAEEEAAVEPTAEAAVEPAQEEPAVEPTAEAADESTADAADEEPSDRE